jgi:hypothetical protein
VSKETYEPLHPEHIPAIYERALTILHSGRFRPLPRSFGSALSTAIAEATTDVYATHGLPTWSAAFAVQEHFARRLGFVPEPTYYYGSLYAGPLAGAHFLTTLGNSEGKRRTLAALADAMREEHTS